MLTRRRRRCVRRTTNVAVWLLLASMVGCLPTRRDNDPSASAADAGQTDAVVDAGTDASAGDAGAVADGADGGGADTQAADVPIPEGCKQDSQCAALVTSPCHQAACDLASGLCTVIAAADGATCGTSNKCLTKQTCQKGACVGVAVDCDDGDVCTTDSCNKLSGCVTNFNDSACNDGDPCTDQDKCNQGKCTSKARQCLPTNDVCSMNICVKIKGGCVVVPRELAKDETCSDGDGCTDKDTCVAGLCVGKPIVCPEDNDPCTVAACETKAGKSECATKGAPLTACDDKNPCTEMDRCESTQADANKYECAGSPKSCADDNPCTDDACDAGKCGYKPNDAKACSDDNPCTVETCKAGKCVSTAGPSCDDGNLCTNDSCAPKQGGCVHTGNTDKCSDGDVCTDKDSCAKSACSGQKAICDDGNPCTSDTCAAGVGCVASGVKNGTTCAAGGQCWGGGCIVAKCGNTVCEFNEDSTSCAGDCPTGGGLCAVNDATCVAQCRADRCAAPVKTCADEQACPILLTCLDKCTNDACRLGCVKTASAAAVTAYYALSYCLATKCHKNSWDGKQCKTSAVAYPACIGACQSGVCTGEEMACNGTAACASIATCVAKCPLNDNTCPVSCIKAPGDTMAADTYDTLSVCVQAKCL